METPIIRTQTEGEFTIKEIVNAKKFRRYEGIDFYRIEDEDDPKKTIWRKEGPDGEILPEEGSLEDFLGWHPNKTGLVEEDGYYNWKKLKEIIKKEGYNPEEHNSYIQFEDFSEDSGVIYDYILTSGGHRLTVMIELYNEGHLKDDYVVKVKLNKSEKTDENWEETPR
jgi:hypothetical protein